MFIKQHWLRYPIEAIILVMAYYQLAIKENITEN